MSRAAYSRVALGCDLKSSPNQDGVPNRSAQCRDRQADCEQTVHAIENAAMPGYQAAAVLDTEMALDRRLEEIAGLLDERQGPAYRHRDPGVDVLHQERNRRAYEACRRHSAGESGPGLVGADARRQLRSADAAPGDVGAGIGRP